MSQKFQDFKINYIRTPSNAVEDLMSNLETTIDDSVKLHQPTYLETSKAFTKLENYDKIA